MQRDGERPEIDKAAFHGPLGQMVTDLDPYTEADPVGVLASLLAAFSAYVGEQPRVSTGKGAMPLVFWPVLVGQTGMGRKGTATGHALKVIEAGLQGWAEKDIVHSLPATGLGFIGELHERSDFDGGTDPVLFIEEEMDAFITAAKKDTKIGVYLRKAWDAATLRHRTSKDDIVVRRPHAAIIGHVQPRNWGAIAGSRDATGGTYNRFLPLFVQRSKTLPVFGADDVTGLAVDLGAKLRKLGTYAREVPLVEVPDKVARRFEKFHRPELDALIMGNEELAQMSERALAYCIRLAALYALSDRREQVKVADLDAALALVAYSVETVLLTLPEAERREETPEEKIMRVLAANGGTMRSTELLRETKLQAAVLRVVVEESPYIEAEEQKGARGRPTVLYRLADTSLDES